ncbi:MAG: putative sulfate exporter family transporter [Alphaproteobacteria bacterium]|nr:putative sulfate exporter family transporter [Alphaproteobacteria bacterium]
MAYSIIGLGAGMNLHIVAEAGLKGLGYTFISIMLTLALGMALGRLFRSDREVSWLVSAGTAICGGSAIAALSPVLGAKDHSVSVSLAVVFFIECLRAVFLSCDRSYGGALPASVWSLERSGHP